MSDLIDRQAAIDALIRKQRPVNNGDGTMTVTMLTDAVIKDVLKALPSVQDGNLHAGDGKPKKQKGV